MSTHMAKIAIRDIKVKVRIMFNELAVIRARVFRIVKIMETSRDHTEAPKLAAILATGSTELDQSIPDNTPPILRRESVQRERSALFKINQELDPIEKTVCGEVQDQTIWNQATEKDLAAHLLTLEFASQASETIMRAMIDPTKNSSGVEVSQTSQQSASLQQTTVSPPPLKAQDSADPWESEERREQLRVECKRKWDAIYSSKRLGMVIQIGNMHQEGGPFVEVAVESGDKFGELACALMELDAIAKFPDIWLWRYDPRRNKASESKHYWEYQENDREIMEIIKQEIRHRSDSRMGEDDIKAVLFPERYVVALVSHFGQDGRERGRPILLPKMGAPLLSEHLESAIFTSHEVRRILRLHEGTDASKDKFWELDYIKDRSNPIFVEISPRSTDTCVEV